MGLKVKNGWLTCTTKAGYHQGKQKVNLKKLKKKIGTGKFLKIK